MILLIYISSSVILSDDNELSTEPLYLSDCDPRTGINPVVRAINSLLKEYI